MNRILSITAILLLIFNQSAYALDPDELSIEQLMGMKVTTPTKTEQSFSDTASALFVITENDIKRSGVTSIPDALRMAPGINVAQITSSKWAISARGFNGRFASKLLVLIDGRAVYTPDFNGVYWETQDLVLEDVDRIEVVRGPGASIWGTNSVNGVINIITKHTEETQGAMISAIAGDEDQAIVSLRYGGNFNEQTQYRVYGKYLNRDGFVDQNGEDANDEWNISRGGFRLDWNSVPGNDRIMLQGDYYAGEIDQNFNAPAPLSPSGLQPSLETGDVKGGNIMLNWNHDFSLSSRLSAQFYYDYYHRDDAFQNSRRETFDFDLKHEMALSSVNHLTIGGGYRLSEDLGQESEFATLRPGDEAKDLHLYHFFFQDRHQFFDDAVELSFGTRVQHYSFGGWQFEPSAKALWKINPNHRIWGSVSRATRRPSRSERDVMFKPLRVLPPTPFSVVVTGNPELDPETVLSYELGYRFWATESLSIDITGFYNDYDDVVSVNPGQVNFATFEVPFLIENTEEGETWGMELSSDWRPFEETRLQFSYSYLRSNFKLKIPNTSGLPLNFGDDRNPKHQVSLRLSQDLMYSVTADLWLRHVSAIEEMRTTLPGLIGNVESYEELDARLGWTPIKNLELSLVGRNLLNSNHLEFLEEIGTYPTQVERSFHGQIKYQF